MTSWWRVARIVLGGLTMLFAFTALYVAAFHAPRAEGFDVGVVGAPARAASLRRQLDAEDRGAFDVRRYDTEVHGVLVPGAARDRVLVAQAFGVAPTEAVTDALRGAAAATRTPASVAAQSK